MRRAALLATAVLLLLPVGGLSSLPAGAAAKNCRVAGLPKTVRYRTIAGVAAKANSLDVYAPAGACNRPVVLWVHGGGYEIGDKKNQVTNKISLFNGKGWVFASINYRLTVPGDPSSARYPDHFDDVAAAVAWVKANIGRYGGNPAKIALLGHSAGADIVSNVADNPAYLAAHGLTLKALTCVGPLDTEGFDKTTATSEDGDKQFWIDALGNDPHYQVDTSASTFVKRGIGIPRTIGVYRGSASRQQIEKAYLAKLRAAGVGTTTIDARSLTHNEVNTRIGAPGDKVMTPPLVSFLTSCFA